MATRKKKTSSKKAAASKNVRKPAGKKATSRGAKPASKSAARSKGGARKGGKVKTRAEALAEARRKVPRQTRTPKLGARLAAAVPQLDEMYQKVIQAYAAASREMAEWLAAARRSDKTA